MKFFRKGSIILFFVFVFIFINNRIICQVSYSNLEEIIDLYIAEHYDVALAKLSNLGFELRQSTPDYSEGKFDFKGDFIMVSTDECLDLIPPHNRIRKMGYIKFATVSDPSQKSVDIEYSLPMTNAKSLIQLRIEQLTKEIGPPEIIKTDVDNVGVTFYDRREFYAKDVEDPKYLINISLRSYIHYSYYINHFNCTVPFPVLEANIGYNIPKYPVENKEEYWQNFEANKDIIIVPVKRQGNTYSVEINVGGKNIVYIIDSGASEMVISSSFIKYLTDLGVIRDSDFLPNKTFTLADGSERNYRRVKIPVVRIGTIKVEDVEAAIVDDNSPLLLGKSFLDKFRYWKINNSNQTIELRY